MLTKVEEDLALDGGSYLGERVFTKQQVMTLFDISDGTVERYLSARDEGMKRNGYLLIRGRKLKDFRSLIDVSLIGEGNKAAVRAVQLPGSNQLG